MQYSRLFDNKGDCSICLEVSGKADYGDMMGQDWHTATLDVGGSERFLAIPSLGALVKGHSLVITRAHEGSVVTYAHRENCWGELGRVIKETSAGISKQLGVADFLLFEQGTTSADALLCSTSHAHLHLVPLFEDALATMEVTFSDGYLKLSAGKLSDACLQAGDFVVSNLIREGTLDNQWYFTLARGLRSQHMRRIVGTAVGAKTWDWRMDPFSATYRQTVDVFVALQNEALAV